MFESGQLFAADVGKKPTPKQQLEPGSRLVAVWPDVSGIAKRFTYSVPPRWAAAVEVGSIVRVTLNGRSVSGWVVETDIEQPDYQVHDIHKISSIGPTQEILSLAQWAADRWCGKLSKLFKTASPPRNYARRPASATSWKQPAAPTSELAQTVLKALETKASASLLVAPTSDYVEVVTAAASQGSVLVIVPTKADVKRIAGGLRRKNIKTNLLPQAWNQAITGGVTIGTRAAIWAPSAASLTSIIVLDSHDESLQAEQQPTWHACDMALERARRRAISCLVVSPCVSVATQQRVKEQFRLSTKTLRNGWPVIEVIDRRDEDPGRGGLFAPQLGALVADKNSIIAVLNTKGRASLLACASCGELVKTQDGEQVMAEKDGELVAATGERRPKICAICNGTSLKRLRLGVTRAAEEFAALLGRDVAEMTATTDVRIDASVILGTEAVLRRKASADMAVFLDFDQELLASRYRAGEQAMALLCAAARRVGPRSSGGRVIVQTRNPKHRVLQAAVLADPSRCSAVESAMRQAAQLPPFGALAEVSHQGAEAFVEQLQTNKAISVLGPNKKGAYLLKAASWTELSEAVAATKKPPGRLRIAVDPPRV